MKAGGLRFLGREVGVVLPGVRAGLEAGGIFEVEAGGIGAGSVFKVVGEEFGFDPGAELLADGLGVVEIAEAPGGRGPVAVAPGAEDKEIPVVGVVGLQG